MRSRIHINIFICLVLVISFFDIKGQNKEVVDSLINIVQLEHDESTLFEYYYIISRNSSDPLQVEKYASLCLEIALALDNDIKKSQAYFQLGDAKRLQGDLPEALDFFFKSLKIFNLNNDLKGKTAAYNSIGSIYIMQEDYKKAVYYLRKAISLNKNRKDTTNIAGDFNNIGEAYRNWGRLDTALTNFRKAFILYDKIDYKIGKAYALGNIGLVFADQSKNDSAEYYINKATILLNQLGDRYPIAVYQTHMADIYKDKGDLESALDYAHQSLQIAQEESLKEQIRDASKKLAELYKDLEDYENAFKYQSQYIAYGDSINNEATIRKMADLRTEYEVSQKQAEVELLSEKQRTQQIINISLSIVLFLVAVIAFIWYQNSQSRKRTNQILSEQKEEIEAQRDKLEEMVKMKDRFFGIISHDLRSPVNSLQGLSKLLSHYASSKQYGELETFIPLVEQSINNLSSLVDNLLSWAMSQQGEMPYHPQRVKLYYTVEEVKKLFSNLASAKKIDLYCEVSKDVEAWADRDGVFAVLRNLVNNAIKFTPENGKVWVNAEQNNTYTYVKVSDTGNGIPDDKIGQLFEYDKHKSTKGTAGEKGSGLGLALCKEIVEVNKGYINIDSKSGKGTTFTIKLPLEPEDS